MNILVVVAHPDDEVLGCGGTIARHTDEGDSVTIVILAEGATSRTLQRDRNAAKIELAQLADSANAAAGVLGVSDIILHDFPDNRMDSVDLLDIIKVVEGEIRRIDPDVIYTHHCGDLNLDHKITHQAVVTAFRPQKRKTPHRILFFEVPSSSEWRPAGSGSVFVPSWFVNISRNFKSSGTPLERKLKALKAYQTEIRDWPHSRSEQAVNHLACWRGATVGIPAAEAFVLGRAVV